MRLRPDHLIFWTPRQRIIVAGFVFVTCAMLLALHLRQPVLIDDPAPPGDLADRISGKIDPNTADAAALAAIPMLGEKHAALIVAYRTQFSRSHPGHRAFNVIYDLMNVKGIGPGTIKNLEPYLEFPAPAIKPGS